MARSHSRVIERLCICDQTVSGDVHGRLMTRGAAGRAPWPWERPWGAGPHVEGEQVCRGRCCARKHIPTSLGGAWKPACEPPTRLLLHEPHTAHSPRACAALSHTQLCSAPHGLHTLHSGGSPSPQQAQRDGALGGAEGEACAPLGRGLGVPGVRGRRPQFRCPWRSQFWQRPNGQPPSPMLRGCREAMIRTVSQVEAVLLAPLGCDAEDGPRPQTWSGPACPGPGAPASRAPGSTIPFMERTLKAKKEPRPCQAAAALGAWRRLPDVISTEPFSCPQAGHPGPVFTDEETRSEAHGWCEGAGCVLQPCLPASALDPRNRPQLEAWKRRGRDLPGGMQGWKWGLPPWPWTSQAPRAVPWRLLAPTPPFLQPDATLQARRGLCPMFLSPPGAVPCEPVKDASVYPSGQRPHDHTGPETPGRWLGRKREPLCGT